MRALLSALTFGLVAAPGAAKPKAKRSPRWPAFRDAVVAAHPYCAACLGRDHLQVHHVLPVSWPGGKERELDPANVIVLCEAPDRPCHRWLGHLGDFRSRNPDVVADVARWRAKVTTRPYPPKGD